jgi:hypothetical protein
LFFINFLKPWSRVLGWVVQSTMEDREWHERAVYKLYGGHVSIQNNMVHFPFYFNLTSNDVECPVWYEMSLTLFCSTQDVSKSFYVSVLETSYCCGLLCDHSFLILHKHKITVKRYWDVLPFKHSFS